MPKPNPRRKNGSRRTKQRNRVIAASDTCALCGKPVDKTIKTPHDLSPEVDEITPVSLGGDPLDYDNMQLTHRICNRLKGDKLMVSPGPGEAAADPLPVSRDW